MNLFKVIWSKNTRYESEIAAKDADEAWLLVESKAEEAGEALIKNEVIDVHRIIKLDS